MSNCSVFVFLMWSHVISFQFCWNLVARVLLRQFSHFELLLWSGMEIGWVERATVMTVFIYIYIYIYIGNCYCDHQWSLCPFRMSIQFNRFIKGMLTSTLSSEENWETLVPVWAYRRTTRGIFGYNRTAQGSRFHLIMMSLWLVQCMIHTHNSGPMCVYDLQQGPNVWVRHTVWTQCRHMTYRRYPMCVQTSWLTTGDQCIIVWVEHTVWDQCRNMSYSRSPMYAGDAQHETNVWTENVIQHYICFPLTFSE